MPSESPLWSNDWFTDNLVISLGKFIWICSAEEIHVSDTTSCHHLKVDITVSLVIIDPPILSSSIVNEDSEPGFISSFSENEWMSAISILIWVSNGLLWINWISSPQTVHTIIEEQISCGLLYQSHYSLKAIGTVAFTLVDMSLSLDDIDVFSKGHLTRKSEEVSFLLNLNFECISSFVQFDINPIAKFTFVRQDCLVNTSDVHWNGVWHFLSGSVVGVSPTDAKDIGVMLFCVYTIEDLESHGKIWLSRVCALASCDVDLNNVLSKIWLSS